MKGLPVQPVSAVSQRATEISTIVEDLASEIQTYCQRRVARIVVGPSGCWEWLGARMPNGYGYIFMGVLGRQYVHRFSVKWSGREIPKGMQVDHLCRNRGCANPLHLDVVTPKVNSHRGGSPWAMKARKQVCPQGHRYTPENTITKKNGCRTCKTCAYAGVRRWKQRQQAVVA